MNKVLALIPTDVSGKIRIKNFNFVDSKFYPKLSRISKTFVDSPLMAKLKQLKLINIFLF